MQAPRRPKSRVGCGRGIGAAHASWGLWLGGWRFSLWLAPFGCHLVGGLFTSSGSSAYAYRYACLHACIRARARATLRTINSATASTSATKFNTTVLKLVLLY